MFSSSIFLHCEYRNCVTISFILMHYALHSQRVMFNLDISILPNNCSLNVFTFTRLYISITFNYNILTRKIWLRPCKTFLFFFTSVFQTYFGIRLSLLCYFKSSSSHTSSVCLTWTISFFSRSLRIIKRLSLKHWTYFFTHTHKICMIKRRHAAYALEIENSCCLYLRDDNALRKSDQNIYIIYYSV